MIYREKFEDSKKYKEEYINGFDKILKNRRKEAELARESYIKKVFKNQEKYREDFKKMLGWPLVGYDKTFLPKISCEKLSEEDGYTIYRMQFEIIKGLKMTGLFFKCNCSEKKPLIIVQHGGMGTPELISGIEGDTSNYNDILHRVIQYDVHAFAPQLLLWSEERGCGINTNRKEIDAKLKRVGSSITAIEIHGITQIIDYFEKQDYVSNFGMIGLSYGGFYTLYTAAIDKRIKSAISCSFFNTRDVYDWIDWTWFKSAEKFDDAEIACLIYPRKLCLQIGNKDECFDYKYGIDSFEKLKKYCEPVGTDWINFIVFDGTHEFCKDDSPITDLITEVNKSI